MTLSRTIATDRANRLHAKFRQLRRARADAGFGSRHRGLSRVDRARLAGDIRVRQQAAGDGETFGDDRADDLNLPSRVRFHLRSSEPVGWTDSALRVGEGELFVVRVLGNAAGQCE